MITLWAQAFRGGAASIGRKVYQNAVPSRASFFKKTKYFKELLHALQRERACLMKWQVTQEGQIDAGRPGEVIVDRIRMLIHFVGQLQKRQSHIGLDGHVEIGFAVRGNDQGMVADAARD